VLDEAYIAQLGVFDVVYSWGVLHHTGKMWAAIDRACRAVAPNGLLFIAIYNDLGSSSVRWRWIKRTYNRLPRAIRPLWTLAAMSPEEAKSLGRALLSGRPKQYVNRWRDMVDWVGGYPYEVAKPEEVFAFCQSRGFSLRNLRCGGVGLGCNEFVFDRGVFA
jgi:2-polyprenyl-6-hydroxyphenyl methylase/3-demethylubiquinone-9 3-methyltransferase